MSVLTDTLSVDLYELVRLNTSRDVAPDARRTAYLVSRGIPDNERDLALVVALELLVKHVWRMSRPTVSLDTSTASVPPSATKEAKAAYHQRRRDERRQWAQKLYGQDRVPKGISEDDFRESVDEMLRKEMANALDRFARAYAVRLTKDDLDVIVYPDGKTPKWFGDCTEAEVRALSTRDANRAFGMAKAAAYHLAIADEMRRSGAEIVRDLVCE